MGNLIKMMVNWGLRLQVTGHRLKIRPKPPLLFRFGLAAMALTVGVCLFGPDFALAEDNFFTDNVGIGTTSPLSALDVRGTIENGLVAWWSMDEGSGDTTSDQSINSNDGSLGVGTTAPTWVTGKFGKALDFDGDDDYVDVGDVIFTSGDSITTEDITVSAWVKTTNSGAQYAIGKFQDSSNYVYFRIETDYMKFLATKGGTTIIDIYNNVIGADSGQWTHIAVILPRGNTPFYYKNGINQTLVGTTCDTGDISNTGDFHIARRDTVYFNGLIDEVRVYNRALSAREIAELYRQGAPSMAQGGTVSDELLVLDGNVGIGTTEPDGLLGIGTTGAYITASANDLVFYDTSYGSTRTLTQLTAGGDSDWTITGNDLYSAVSDNVGIGTSTPSAKLQVSGNVSASGIIVATDTITDFTGTGLELSGNDLVASLGTSIVTGEITDSTILELDLSATNAPEDTYVLSYDNTSGGFTWIEDDDQDEDWDIDGDDIYHETGNIGIGTSTPVGKLHVGVGTTAPNAFVVHPTSGNIGIGTTTPEAALHIGTTSASNITSPSTSLMVSGELEVGSSAYLGPMKFVEDSGVVSWIDMSVSATPSAGTPESYTARIDGENILTIYAEADHTGGIQNIGVGIATTSPAGLLGIGTTGAYITASANDLVFYDAANATTRTLTQLTAGGDSDWTITGNDLYSAVSDNVGIGTSTPSAKLQVSGNVSASGIIVATDTITDFTGTGLELSGNDLVASLGTSIVTGEITDSTILELDLSATNAPEDTYVLSYDNTSGGFTWIEDDDDDDDWTITGNDLYSAVSDNVGIGTSTPVGKLHVGIATTAPNAFVVHPTSGNVGIGTSTPEAALHIGTTSASNISTPSTSLMVSGELEVGSTAYLGPMEFTEDSGVVSWIDMSVSDAPTQGAKESYIACIDGTDILTIYAEADGDGGIQNDRVGIGTSTPVGKLHVGIATTAPNAFVVHPTTGNVGIGTTSPAGLLGIGTTGAYITASANDLVFYDAAYASTRTLTQLAAGGASEWTETASVLHPADSSGEQVVIAGGTSTADAEIALNYSGASWFTGGNVGIGTTEPGYELDVTGVGRFDNSAAGTYAIIVQNTMGGDDKPIAKFDHDSGTVVDINKNYFKVGGYVDTTLFASGHNSSIQERVGIADITPDAKLEISTNAGSDDLLMLSFNDDNDGDLLIVKNSGNVGIGTTTPDGLLGIGTTGAYITASANDLVFYDATASTKTLTELAAGGADSDWTITGNDLYSAVSDNVGIGTSTPVGKLHVGIATTAPNAFVVHPTSGNIGIGTSTPEAALHIGTTSPGNITSPSTSLMVSGELEVGSTAYLGPMEFAEDSGVISWIDMSVSATPSAGTPESYTARIDEENILTIYAEADHTGGIQNIGVGIGTTSPAGLLGIGITGAYITATANDLVFYDDAYGSTRTLSQLAAGGASEWTETASVLHPADSSGEQVVIAGGTSTSDAEIALNYNGASWFTGGNVGIGTTNPSATLEVDGTVKFSSNANIKGKNEHMRFTILTPHSIYDDNPQVCLWAETDTAITITHIEVTCDADPAPNQPAMSLKYADNFIGRVPATDTTIDVITTSNGTTSITSGFDDPNVAADKCIYVTFDADPNASIKQIGFDVTYDYD